MARHTGQATKREFSRELGQNRLSQVLVPPRIEAAALPAILAQTLDARLQVEGAHLAVASGQGRGCHGKTASGGSGWGEAKLQGGGEVGDGLGIELGIE